jgi:hypothetical protein
LKLKWLGQEIIDLGHGVLGRTRRIRREHNDCLGRGDGFDGSSEYVSSHFRHSEVGDDEVEFAGAKESESVRATAGRLDGVALGPGEPGEHIPDVVVVIEDKNAEVMDRRRSHGEKEENCATPAGAALFPITY